MRIVITAITVLCLSTFLLVSCTKDKVVIDMNPINTDCPDTISYATQVEPVLNQSCATSGCHGGGGSTNGYDLTNHTNVAANANIILSVIRHESGVTAMPFGGAPQLPDSVAQHIECWISQGKLNN